MRLVPIAARKQRQRTLLDCLGRVAAQATSPLCSQWTMLQPEPLGALQPSCPAAPAARSLTIPSDNFAARISGHAGKPNSHHSLGQDCSQNLCARWQPEVAPLLGARLQPEWLGTLAARIRTTPWAMGKFAARNSGHAGSPNSHHSLGQDCSPNIWARWQPEFAPLLGAILQPESLDVNQSTRALLPQNAAPFCNEETSPSSAGPEIVSCSPIRAKRLARRPAPPRRRSRCLHFVLFCIPPAASPRVATTSTSATTEDLQ